MVFYFPEVPSLPGLEPTTHIDLLHHNTDAVPITLFHLAPLLSAISAAREADKRTCDRLPKKYN